ncbi:MAG: cupin domain-containing protein [Xanthomonadales bacterium]|nr:cupin domain-containing protein [Xanthomonadales bacterium]
MDYQTINLREKLTRFDDTWAPKVIAEINDYQVKLVKLDGEFLWHSHEETDEGFLCLEGEMTIELRDGAVTLKPDDMFIVPRGMEHRVVDARGCSALLIEPRGVLNTGDGNSDLAAENDVWV